MKGHGIIQLMSLIALKRAGVPLAHDVVLIGNADEEIDGLGSHFHDLIRSRALPRRCMLVRIFNSADYSEWRRMRDAFWPDQTAADMAAWLARPDAAVLVAERTPSGLSGFAEVGARSIAEGCTTSPVAYLERRLEMANLLGCKSDQDPAAVTADAVGPRRSRRIALRQP